ncbi:tumor necrosis factor receptor superfamily member 1A [Salminus brasiliensis]|uniref:tumor necrosis factor receptor superfamily member 1A n=1 Tax=Salminus brasiliensis TaxID=930266 RepID=UPI003B8369A4
MDAGHDRRKWRRSCMPCVLILLTLLSGVVAQYENSPGRNTSESGPCADNEYMNKDGICCDRCSPGFKLTNECAGKGLRSSCEKCSEGTFLEVTNHFRNCFTCLKCKQYEEEISKCTHEKNTVCACKPGYYRSVINPVTSSCRLCKKCGSGEKERRECGGEKNTECECKALHYRVGKNVCAPCRNCTEECFDLCPTTPITRELAPPTPDSQPAIVIILAVALAVVLVGVFLTVVIRRCKKKKRTSLSPESPDSQKYETKQISVITTKSNEDAVLTSHCTEYEQDQLLPDCVPREIRTHEFIYFVLEVVPINRFKELARRLNVSEQDIDRAERDNRAFADAQYQMLKVWSDNAPGGGKNILPRPLLQEFVDRLKDMNLNGCAENIENKYCTEA